MTHLSQTAIWLTLIGMALATYLTRVATMLALRGDMAPWLRRWLGYVPVAVFTALALPPLLLQSRDGARVLALGPALPAGVAGALVAWRGGNVLLTLLAGMATFWALRWLGM
ncbi:AzlD domain-containing protein [Kouleothrix sp.]|uniref:AzlD domain-containing protein n=1 Tax=Kouleothrix sp. TaxID=2779161 RepID=UPI0039196449